ncbi:MAG: phosphatidate cytidylyltransferase [Candidatus Hydrogenedentota bacterium]
MNLLKRILVAIVFIPIIIFCIKSSYSFNIYKGINISFFDILMIVIFILGNLELYHLLKNIEPQINGIIFLVSGLSLLIASLFIKNAVIKISFVYGFFLLSASIMLIGMFIILFSLLFSIIRHNIQNAFKAASLSVAGFFYVPVLSSLYILIRQTEKADNYILCFFIISWMTDVGAFIIGSLIGKRPLSRRVSSNKTVEGAIGGILFSVITSLILFKLGYFSVSLKSILFLGIILSLTGQFGDLVESLIKREAGVKDSGILLAGHGGILDALDSTIFNALPLLIYSLIRGGNF